MRRQTAVLVVLGTILVVLAVREHVLHVGTDTGLLLAAIVPSIILHEVSHGVVALWCGDDTAKRAGRLTLNPIPHIDPFGTIILPAVLALSGAAAFGYAKPVPVDVRRLRHPRNQSLLVSLAGPGTNIALALLSVLWLRVVRAPSVLQALADDPASVSLLDRLWFFFGYVNVLLATFNLIPLPPLDGSALVERVLPASWWPGWLKLRRFAMPALILLVLLRPTLLNSVFDPALRLWGRVLRGVSSLRHTSHLVRRFAGSLSRRPPPPGDEAWVAQWLGPGEHRLWLRCPPADRRHAVGVARRTAALLGGEDRAGRAVLAAALLHDVGKIDAGLGPWRRSVATVAGMAGGRDRARRWDRRGWRTGRYLCHDERGAAMLQAAGADPLTVAWAAEHHLAPPRWSVPADIAHALKAADDD